MERTQSLEKKLKFRNTILAILVTFVLAVITGLSWNLYYSVNDDVTIGKTLAGSYIGVPYFVGIVIQYPLACLLSFLFRIFPIIDVYGWFLVLSHFVCFYLIIKKSLNKLPCSKIKLLVLISAAFLVIDIPNIIYFQFTTTAALYAVTGVFVLIIEEASFRKNVISLVLVLMALCIRKETFIMILPFVVLAWFTKIFENPYKIKKVIKEGVCYFLLVGVLSGVIIGVHKFAGRENYMDEYLQEFNAGRKNIRDYDGVPDYDTNLEFYQKLGGQGISNAEYQVIRYQMVTMDFSIDIKEIVTEMRQYNLLNKKEAGLRYRLLAGMIKFLPIFQRVLVRPQVLVVLFIAVILGIYFIVQKKWLCVFFLWGGCFGVMGEIMLLIYRGRMPERVIQSLMLIAVFWMLGCFIHFLCESQDEDIFFEKRKCEVVYAMLIMACLGLFFSLSIPAIDEKQEEYAERYRLSTLVGEYCANHSENIYFSPYNFLSGDTDQLGSAYEVRFDNRIRIGLLPYTESYYKLMNRAGIAGTVEEAITLQDNVYLIGKDTTGQLPVLDNYFAWKYGMAYSYEVVDDLGDSIYVWKVHLNQH